LTNRCAYLVLVVACLLSGCFRSLELPQEPGPRPPGTIQGRLVYAKPGEATPQPAKGAAVYVLNTTLAATASNEGRFLLEGIRQSEGLVLFRLDIDGDGRPDRQRTMKLEDLSAGQGKQIALGDVQMGRNARVTGKLLLGDKLEQRGGHGGTTLFVPEAPYVSETADDGSFVLAELPEGKVRIAVLRSGYQPVLYDEVELRPGEEFALGQQALSIATETPTPGEISGTVEVDGAADVTGTRVVLTDGTKQLETTTDSQGRWNIRDVMPGRYDVIVSRPGSETAVSFNAVVRSGTATQQAKMLLTPAGTSAGNSDAGRARATLQEVLNSSSAGRGASDGGTTSQWECVPNAGSNTAPIAVVAPSTVVAVGERPHLQGGRSYDPDCEAITFHWSQVLGDGPSVGTLDPNDSIHAAQTSFDFVGDGGQAMPNLEFKLEVEDLRGARSQPATTKVVFFKPPNALLDAPSSLVPRGRMMMLSASGSKDPQGLALVYRWSIVDGAGTLLPSLDGTQAEFILMSPKVTVELEVKSNPAVSGLTNLVRRTFEEVVVMGPFDSGIPLGDGGPAGELKLDNANGMLPKMLEAALGAELRFFENIDPASVNSGAANPSNIKVWSVTQSREIPLDAFVKNDQRTVAILYRTPLEQGSYELRLGAIKSVSGLVLPQQSIPFSSPGFRWPAPQAISDGGMPQHPYLGVAAFSQGYAVFGRGYDQGGALVARGGFFDNLMGTMGMKEELFSSGVLQAASSPPEYRRTLRAGDRIFASFSTDDWFERLENPASAAASWSRRTKPPGPPFSDEKDVFAAVGTATGLQFYSFDANAQWTKAQKNVDDSLVWVEGGIAQGTGSRDGTLWVAAIDNMGNLHVYERISEQFWAHLGPSFMDVSEFRIALVSGVPVVALSDGARLNLRTYVWKDPSWVEVLNDTKSNQQVQGFDLVGRGDTAFLVTAEGMPGQIRLQTMSPSPPSFPRFKTVSPMMSSQFSLNHPQGCDASKPEAFVGIDRLAIVWAEYCTPEGFVGVLRKID
jgi:hypothetical protein